MAPSCGNFPLPTEVVLLIFSHLPSLSNVFALGATCSQLRSIWFTNVTAIYKRVAPRSIPCLQHARRFLADQGGPALEAHMSVEDVIRMVANANIVEKAILQFEREIVCRVRTDSLSIEELESFYGAGARGHPPNLTCRERPRFISSYYTLWSLMKLDSSEWQSRIEHMKIEQLFRLREMTKLTQSIGREEVVPPPQFPDAPPNSVHSINYGTSEKRATLETRVWQQIEVTAQRNTNGSALYPDIYAKHEGFMFFVVMWDHWQPFLNEIVLSVSAGVQQVIKYDEKGFWDDDPEE